MKLLRQYKNKVQKRFFRLELSRELYWRSKFIPPLGFIAVVLFSIYFYSSEISTSITTWAVVFSIIYALMYVLFFDGGAEPKEESYIYWTWSFILACCIAAAMWGIFPFIVFPSLGHSDQVALIMMLFAIISVPVPALSHCSPLVFTYSAIIVISGGSSFLIYHDGFDKHLAFMVVLLFACIMYLLEQRRVSKKILKSVDDKDLLKTSGITIKRLRHDKYHDSVTDLLNREGISTYLNRTDASLSSFIIFALKVRDVDALYSSHSKSSIDEIIRDLASRLQASGFDHKIIAHLGLGEFLILVPGVEGNMSHSLGGDLFGLFEEPVTTFLGPMNFNLLIGCSAFPDDSSDKKEVVNFALAALKEADKHSGNRLERYTEDMAMKMNRRAFIRSQLSVAIKRKEFSVHIQPKINVQKNIVESGEVLVRWYSPSMGMVSPAEFIPIAESTSDIIPLGKWVLEETARILIGSSTLPDKFSLAVNVSVKQLTDPQFVPLVQEITGQLHGTGRSLELEITETMMITDEIEVNQALERISALGVGIALDDFGTGYSSLSYLASINADTLKLDKSFIDPIPQNGRHSSFVSTVIAMAHSLDMPLVAEGVETAEQYEWLSQNLCDTVQGYFISKPLALDEFFTWLDNNVCKETNQVSESVFSGNPP